jgi:spore germination protein GerM
MQLRGRRLFAAGVAALCACFLVAAVVDDAQAQRKTKTERFDGRFQGFDAATNTVKVKKGSQEEVFSVKPEGSVLTRTTVKINGHGGKVTDLPPNAPIIVYWVPDESNPKQKFARSIDAPNIPKELLDELDRQQ